MIWDRTDRKFFKVLLCFLKIPHNFVWHCNDKYGNKTDICTRCYIHKDCRGLSNKLKWYVKKDK